MLESLVCMTHTGYFIWEGCPSGQRRRAVNSLAYAYGGSNPSPSMAWNARVAQFGRASAFQAEGRGFESRLSLCPGSSGVERVLGKDEVVGSNPTLGLFYKEINFLGGIKNGRF